MRADQPVWRRALLMVAFLAILVGLPQRSATAAPSRDKGISSASVASKIDPRLSYQVGLAQYFVVLRDQAATGNAIPAWGDRGQFVYNQLTATANASQAALRDFLAAQQTAGVVADFRPYWIVNAIFVSSDSSLIATLAARDDVVAIWANGAIRSMALPGADITATSEVTATSTPDVGSNAAQVVSATVHAADAWAQGYSGAGVVVASLDSGVDATHPALAANYRGGAAGDYGFFDAVNGQTTPYDDSGQGTFILGAAVGAEGENNRIGVAPDAQWIAAKVLDADGASSDDRLLTAMQWILAPTRSDGSAPRPDLRPQVVASSWGAVCADVVERQAVQAWLDAGIFPSFASGNGGADGEVAAPAAYPESFGVGAIDPNTGGLAAYSTVGESCYDNSLRPQVLAPGSNVLSSVRGGGYATNLWGGTALAQAQVAGTAALLLSAQPSLSFSDTSRLISTSGPAIIVNSQPFPLLDAGAALAALLGTASPTSTATPTETATPTPTDIPPTDVPPSVTPAQPSATATPTATTPVSPPAPATFTSTPLPRPAATNTPRPTSTPSCNAQFRDVLTSHWAYSYVSWLYCRGAISGYADGTFRPLNLTTRAQFAKMITLVSGWAPANPTTPSFRDVPRSFWAYPYIETVRARRIVSGYADGNFRPLDPVTRGQLAKMIVQSRGWTPRVPAQPTFSDVGPDHWAYSWVETAAARGVIAGYISGETRLFQPDQYATRAQLSKMLFGAFVLR